jgi:hypothetical protein
MKRNIIHWIILDGGSNINNLQKSQNPSLLGPYPGPLTEFGMGFSVADPVLTLSKIHLNLVSFQMVFMSFKKYYVKRNFQFSLL